MSFWWDTSIQLTTTVGTKVLFISNIEDGERLWQQNPSAMQAMLIRHDAILRGRIKTSQGVIFKTLGESFYATFDDPLQAIKAAYESQLELAHLVWSDFDQPIRVNMALHTVSREVASFDEDTDRRAILHCLRILSVANGGQILVSEKLKQWLSRLDLPIDYQLQDLGEHLLQDLVSRESLFRLTGEGLSQTVEPLHSLNNWSHNLPVQTTRLVGREHELSQVMRLFRKQQLRLVTFTGPGGTGKTRLSLQVASDLLQDFPDGVFLVELATLSRVGQVADLITRILGLKETTGRQLLENLKQYLREKQMLLVLDNFEHLLEASSLVSELLAAAPRLRILVTSRTPLKIYGEQNYPVPPLRLPDLTKRVSLKDLTHYPAVDFLLQRIRQFVPAFRLNEQNAIIIAQICVKLDGLPLAIELVAKRFQLFRPEAILSGLEKRLQLLSADQTKLSIRQQTLRGAIEWSYDLLGEDEKTLFTRLSIFSGSFTTQAVEAVCQSEISEDLDILEGITILLDNSLLQLIPTLSENEARFKMLETIREYALEKLAIRDELEQLQELYAHYFVTLAEEAAPALTGPDQAYWFNRLAQEYDNFRDVIERGLQQSESTILGVSLHIGEALWRFWLAHGHLSDGRQWLERGLLTSQPRAEAGSSKFSLVTRAKAFNAAGVLAREQGDFQQARLMLEESLNLQRQLDDEVGLANTLNSLGTVSAYMGEYNYSTDFHNEALTLRRHSGDKRAIAVSLCNLGAVSSAKGDYTQAKSWYEEALDLLEQQEDKRTAALLMHNLAHIYLLENEIEKAKQTAQTGLVFYIHLGDSPGKALVMMQLAYIAKQQNDLLGALELYRQSLSILQEVKEVIDVPSCLEGLGGVLGKLGQPTCACIFLKPSPRSTGNGLH